jgi:hypothetical protein
MLRRADPTQTKRFVREDDPDDWIEFRTSFSKHDDAIINDSTGFDRISTEEGILLRAKAATGDPKVFSLLAVAWSLAEGKPKVEDYEALDVVDAAWIDECLSEAVQIARGEVEEGFSSPTTAEPPSSGGLSPEAATQPSAD